MWKIEINMKPCVYKICCSKTQKIYIGSSVRAYGRWSCHISLLRKGTHHSIHLQRAFNKHGEESFSFEIIEETQKNDLLLREQFWIDEYKPRIYNCLLIAGSPLGVKRSKAFRDKQSKRMKKNTIRRGQKMPEISKQRISKSLIGNKYRKDIPHSNEIKKKISEGLLKAYAENRRSTVDKQKAAKNLIEWNRKVSAGLIPHPRKKLNNQQGD